MKTLLTRLAAFTVGAVLFASALVVSVVFFAVVLAAVLVIGGIFAWRNRHLRRQMQQRYEAREVIEGTVVSSEEVPLPSRRPSPDQRDAEVP